MADRNKNEDKGAVWGKIKKKERENSKLYCGQVKTTFDLLYYKDKKEEEDSESGIVEIEDIASSSSSPALSRPPTPVLTTPVKPQVVAGGHLFHCCC